jgi:hypothetical protein
VPNAVRFRHHWAGSTLPQRSTVLWGALYDEAVERGRTTGMTWSIQNGAIQCIGNTAYKRGDIVVLNSGTEMIGFPELTQEGLFVNCLLNPNLYIKGRAQIITRS